MNHYTTRIVPKIFKYFPKQKVKQCKMKLKLIILIICCWHTCLHDIFENFNFVTKIFKGDTYQSIHPGSVGQENQKCQHHYWEQNSVPPYLDS